MPLFKAFSSAYKKAKKVTTERVRRDNTSDLTNIIREADAGLITNENTVNKNRNTDPVVNRPKSNLFTDNNNTKSETRRKIKMISSFGKEPTARKSGEYMPRSLFNRHNLFGYTGLREFGAIVDRYSGESDNQKINSDNSITIEKGITQNKTDIDNPTDPRNNINAKNVFILHSRGGELGAKIEKYRKNPTAENIIEMFGQDNPDGKFHSVEYDWADFAMTKNYGVIPNNHLVTLRRFPFPVLDNIYDVNLNKFPDIGRMVTWFGEGSGNSLAELMKMEWGFVYKEMQSEMQVIKSGPPSKSLTSQLFGKVGLGALSTVADLTAVATPKSNMFKNTTMQGADFYDFAQHNRMRIDGPVDSIDKITIRDRGLTFEQKFNLTFEYSLKSIGGINPRLAMLDLLGNILFTTYNRGNFWGGAVRYQADLRQSRDIAIGDTDKLMKGDYQGYLKSIPADFQKRFSKMAQGSSSGNNKFADTIAGSLGPLLGSFAKPFANIASGVMGNMVDMFFGKNALASGAFGHMEIPNSLLTNQPTGVWHITVGNPFQPIAVFGNIILEKTSIDFSDTLGWDDFPDSFKVVCELKHPIAKDSDHIQSVFNVGRGPLYHDPYVFNKEHIDGIISQGGLPAYNPYEGNFSITDQGFEFFKDISASKFGMGKIINSAQTYYSSLGGNGPSGAKAVLQNQVFGWFLEGETTSK